MAPPQATDTSRRYSATAHIGDVLDFAASLPETFLHCRELGHNWQPYTVASHSGGGYDRTLICHRCTTLRVMELDWRGLVVRSHYKHPDGYLSKGLGHLAGEDRGALRLESIRRRLPEAVA